MSPAFNDWLDGLAIQLDTELALAKTASDFWEIVAKWTDQQLNESENNAHHTSIWAPFLWAQKVPPNLLPCLLTHFFEALPLLAECGVRKNFPEIQPCCFAMNADLETLLSATPLDPGRKAIRLRLQPMTTHLVLVERNPQKLALRLFDRACFQSSWGIRPFAEPFEPLPWELHPSFLSHSQVFEVANSPDLIALSHRAGLAHTLAALGLMDRLFRELPLASQDEMEPEFAAAVALLKQVLEPVDEAPELRMLYNARAKVSKTLSEFLAIRDQNPINADWYYQTFGITSLCKPPQLRARTTQKADLRLINFKNIPLKSELNIKKQEFRLNPAMKPVLDPNKPLTGLRVLDLSRLYPGPLAAKLMLELGADVTKLEFSSMPDPMRHYPPFIGRESAGYLAVNQGKRERVVDLQCEEDLNCWRMLLKECDILIEGFRPGVLKNLGFDFPSLHQEYPRLILVSITGYGQEGPLAEKAGHDLNYLAQAGLARFFSGADGQLHPPGLQVADIAGGSYMALIGALSALHRRASDGQGSWVDVSMAAGVVPLAALQLAHLWAGMPINKGKGFLAGDLPCYRFYQTSDQHWVALAALEPKFWKRFCEGIARPDWISLQFALGEQVAALHSALESLFAQRSSAEWLAFSREVDCCLNLVIEPKELAESAFIRARNLVRTESRKSDDPIKLLQSPLRFR